MMSYSDGSGPQGCWGGCLPPSHQPHPSTTQRCCHRRKSCTDPASVVQALHTCEGNDLSHGEPCYCSAIVQRPKMDMFQMLLSRLLPTQASSPISQAYHAYQQFMAVCDCCGATSKIDCYAAATGEFLHKRWFSKYHGLAEWGGSTACQLQLQQSVWRCPVLWSR